MSLACERQSHLKYIPTSILPLRRTKSYVMYVTYIGDFPRSVPTLLTPSGNSGEVSSLRKAFAVRRAVLHLNQVVAERLQNEFGDGMEIELQHDSRPVGFDRFHAEVEHGGDLLVALAAGQKLHNLGLARG